MEIEFDAAKDILNVEKHGVSLARSVDLRVFAVVDDARFPEDRQRAYGMLDGVPYCLAFTMRGTAVRAISLRRAHAKELKRHVRSAGPVR